MKPALVPVLFLLTLAAAAQTPGTYAPPRDSRQLVTTFVDWDSLVPRDTAPGQSRQVFDNPAVGLDKLELHITTLNPGKESHPIHRHPWEEMLLVRDGQFDVSINGKVQHAGPGALVFFASNDPHNAKNVGATPGTYYVINFVSDLARAASTRPASEQAVPGKLASTVIDCNSLATTPTKTGVRVVALNSPTLTFLALESHITTLNVGQQSDPDIIDHNDEIVILKSGSVEMTVEGVAGRMNQGAVIYWAPNVKRTIRNIGSVPASYQVFRVTTDKSPKAAQLTPANTAPGNSTLATLYKEDQRVRQQTPLTPDERASITRTDADRLLLVKQMISRDELHSAQDYQYAAFIAQHSHVSTDYLLAHTLALACAAMGDKTCTWMAAASLDRYLQSTKQPQIYGTQFFTIAGSPPTQEPYDRTVVTDGLRVTLGVPNISDQKTTFDELTTHRFR